MASVLNLVSNDSYLSSVEPMSIITSAMVAASLDLPVDKNLGYAWIVPYRGKAQFQLGYKGYIQLAQRSGQYKALNVIEVYEGELKGWNRLTEEFEFDQSGRQSNQVIGYVGYFELLNGFKRLFIGRSKKSNGTNRSLANQILDGKTITMLWPRRQYYEICFLNGEYYLLRCRKRRLLTKRLLMMLQKMAASFLRQK